MTITEIKVEKQTYGRNHQYTRDIVSFMEKGKKSSIPVLEGQNAEEIIKALQSLNK